MKKLIRYLKWLLNDGCYIDLDGKHCGCCGMWYETKTMVPTYLYHALYHRIGVCPECAKLGIELPEEELNE